MMDDAAGSGMYKQPYPACNSLGSCSTETSLVPLRPRTSSRLFICANEFEACEGATRVMAEGKMHLRHDYRQRFDVLVVSTRQSF